MLEILLGLSTSPMVTLPPWPGLAKVQRKKTCFVPVYWSGPKNSPLAGSRDVGASTVNVLLNKYNSSDKIYRLIPLSLSTIQDIEKTSNKVLFTSPHSEIHPTTHPLIAPQWLIHLRWCFNLYVNKERET